jgi:hypothetical protein
MALVETIFLFISLFAPSTLLTHLLQDGVVKLRDDQSMLSPTIFGIPCGIMYLGQLKLQQEPQTY